MTDRQFNCALVVDDDPISVWLQIEVIRTSPEISHTHEASNGEVALQFIKDHCDVIPPIKALCPDLVFLDLNMPVMDGFEFLEAFKKSSIANKEKIKIVVVTSSSNPMDKQRLAPYNIWKFINKPLTPEKVQNLLLM
jgi:CheY-like chemotaxis protein